jgi:hypothetical protein
MKPEKCSVHGCKEKCEGSWIDIADTESKYKYCGRMSFCEKHFKMIMPYIEQKEKEMRDKWKKEHPDGKKSKDGFKTTSVGWAFAPLKFVNEALNQ